MKKVIYAILFAVVAISATTSCNDTQTYAEQKEYERGCINNFINGNCKINKRPVKVISEEEFKAKGEVTDTSTNEYVLFASTGIYMQIVNKGCGEILKNGESCDVLCRFTEYNINGDSLTLSNEGRFAYAATYDKMMVRRTSGTISASFDTSGLLAQATGSTAVPTGWLTPLSYVKLGRPTNADESVAHVKIVVPHDKGHAYATSKVYACFYDITFQKGL